MIISSELFSSSVHEAEEILRAHGFALTRDTQKNSSGDHVAEFVKADEKFLLEWNEREKSLRLEKHSQSRVEDIIYRGLRDADDAECKRAFADAIKILGNYFAPHRHDDDDENICGCTHHHA